MKPNSVYRLYVRRNRGPLARHVTITRGKGGVTDIRAQCEGEQVTGFEVHRRDRRVFVVNMPRVLGFEHDPPTASPQ